MAKSFLDGRLLDLPLSAPFLKWVIGEDLRFEDLHTISPAIGKSLEGLVSLCREKRTVEKNGSLSETQKLKAIEALLYRGATVEDLCLDFTLPGRSDWDMKVCCVLLLNKVVYLVFLLLLGSIHCVCTVYCFFNLMFFVNSQTGVQYR